MAEPAKPSRRSVRYGLGLAAALLFVWGVALPFWHEFSTFGARAKAAEVKRHLKKLCEAQVAKLASAGQPAVFYRDVGYVVDERNRFAYLVAPGSTLERRGPTAPDPTAIGVQSDFERFNGSGDEVDVAKLPTKYEGDLVLGLNGRCPRCSALSVAAGNLDGDDDLDLWSASTAERRTSDGKLVAPCQVLHERDDTRCDDCWYPTLKH
jgi:hypothetical protein